MYGGGGIGIFLVIMELYKDGLIIIKYGLGLLDGGWWLLVKCVVFGVMYLVVEGMLFFWLYGVLW